MTTRNILLTTLAFAMALASCGSGRLEPDTPLGDQIEGDERGEFVTGIISGSGGVMTQAEAECVADQMLGSDLTPAELDDLAGDVTGSGAQDLATSVEDCIDITADVDAPIEGTTNDVLMQGLQSGGWSEAEAECILTGVIEQGFDARDFFVAGYDASAVEGFDATLATIASSCDAG